MRVVEKIEWPEPASVDLLAEFRWIVGDRPVKGPVLADALGEKKVATLKETSPYTQLFAEAHRTKIVLTAAQQAERKVQQVAMAMEAAVEDDGEEAGNQGNAATSSKKAASKKRARSIHMQTTEATILPTTFEFDFAAWKDEANAFKAMPTNVAKSEDKSFADRTDVANLMPNMSSETSTLARKLSTKPTKPTKTTKQQLSQNHVTKPKSPQKEQATKQARKAISMTRLSSVDPDPMPMDAVPCARTDEVVESSKATHGERRPSTTSPPKTARGGEIKAVMLAMPATTSHDETDECREPQERPDEVFTPEFPQDPWITSQLDPTMLTQHLVLDADAPILDHSLTQRPRSAPGMSKYSVEMQARIHATIYANTGHGMWIDQAASHLAAEMSADSIFGDGTAGNAAPFVAPGTTAPDVAVLEAEWIERKALQVFDAAETQLRASDAHGAVAALDDGVRAMLDLSKDASSTTKSTWGFNYAMDVHARATAIQRQYKSRFKGRCDAAVEIARTWRGFHTRHVLAQTAWLRHASACCIQRWWHERNAHKEAMRLRLQTAMRRRLARKHVHTCRMHKKLWRNLGLLVQAWLADYHSIQNRRRRLGHDAYVGLTKDRWIRGYLARQFVKRLKRRIVLDEAARYAAECAYIDAHCGVKMNAFERSLAATAAGAARVSRLALRLKTDAAHRDVDRKRQRLSPAELRRAQMRDVFDAYDVDGSGTIDTDELRYLFDELGIAIDRRGLADAMRAMDSDGNGVIGFDEFFSWLQAPPSSRAARNLRERQELVYLKMKLSVKQLLNRFTSDSFNQHAKRLLLHEERALQTLALRHAFRVSTPPRFACRFCLAPFALYKPFWLHERSCTCNLSRHATGASPEDDEVLRMAHEQAAVDAALAGVADAVHAYVVTKPGRRVLRREVRRVQRFNQAQQIQHGKNTKTEVTRLRDLFQTYDLDQSNSLDRTEFGQITRDLGYPMTAAAIADTFCAIRHTTATGATLSLDDFSAWATDHILRPKTSRPLALCLRQWWTKAVHGKRRRREAEALRYLVAREKIFVAANARRTFRETFPPPYACPVCLAAFCRPEAHRQHSTHASAIHGRQKEKRASVDERIGYDGQTTASVLEMAAREAAVAEKDAAIQRYLASASGRAAVQAKTHVLHTLRHQVNAEHPKEARGRAYVAALVHLCAFDGPNRVPMHSLVYLLPLVGVRHDDAWTKTDDVDSMDETDLVSRILVAKQRQPINARAALYTLRSVAQTRGAARTLVAAAYDHHLRSGGHEWSTETPIGIVSDDDAKRLEFQEFCATPAGQAALAHATMRVDAMEAKWRVDVQGMPLLPTATTRRRERVEARARAVFGALDVDDAGRLCCDDVALALVVLAAPIDASVVWAELDPLRTSEITQGAFVGWYAMPHVRRMFERRSFAQLLTRQTTASPVGHSRRQTRMRSPLVLAIVAIHSRRTPQPSGFTMPSSSPLSLPKSERFSTSSIGAPLVQREMERLQHRWHELPRPVAPRHLVGFVCTAFDDHVVDAADVVAIVELLGGGPHDAALLRQRATAEGTLREADVMQWFDGTQASQATKTMRVRKFLRQVATRAAGIAREKKIVERLAHIAVEARERRRQLGGTTSI
ncbi:Aste57867_13764 [Aphanomyces stellatus]|uniref:Aste57867_13764 protein n=1 Tax=Aphanomyces stellatus TaxID=120398 RepID=A0A485KZV7_9STRA|nr:hypothetical protein As57867_013714 [Aphanomyces stellatus]VFT90597.1 Aste57867_13764 [Aphanomyces stellatus]